MLESFFDMVILVAGIRVLAVMVLSLGGEGVSWLDKLLY